MFIRVKRGGNLVHLHDYLQIVESYRDGDSVRQRAIATLGRLDQLRADGRIDGLIKSLRHFSEARRVIEVSGYQILIRVPQNRGDQLLFFDNSGSGEGFPGF